MGRFRLGTPHSVYFPFGLYFPLPLSLSLTIPKQHTGQEGKEERVSPSKFLYPVSLQGRSRSPSFINSLLPSL